jgi:hypothetical protein
MQDKPLSHPSILFAAAHAFALIACSRPETREAREASETAATRDRVQIAPSHVEAMAGTITQEPSQPATEPPLAMPVEIGNGFRLARMVLTDGVAEREPLDHQQPFRVEERAMVFFEFSNLSGKERALSVIWRAPSPNPPHEPIEIKVPKAERHRTWAYSLPLAHAGTWSCDLLDERSKPVASLGFEVVAPE